MFSCYLNYICIECECIPLRPFKCYVTQMGVGECHIFWKKHYEGVRYNVIGVTRGWGVQFPVKKRYVTLEWPLNEL